MAMVDPKKKGKYIGMVGALLVHVAFILLLILVGFVCRSSRMKTVCR